MTVAAYTFGFMKEINHIVAYRELDDAGELPARFEQLLATAREALNDAYAPYSDFSVGAAALLENGSIVKGSNQENASSPAGICAERVTLSAVSSAHPGVAIVALAITARPGQFTLSEPVAPCGICRQSLVEYEERFKQPIQIILQGGSGKIYWLPDAISLLPLKFGRNSLKR